MPNYKEKIAEFENNFSTVIDKSVRDLSMAFDNLYLDKNAKEIPPTIKLAEALLSGEHNMLEPQQRPPNVMSLLIVYRKAMTRISGKTEVNYPVASASAFLLPVPC